MTAHLGTFIPFQAQNTAWGSNGLNQNIGLGLNGFNPNPAWNAIAALNQPQAYHNHPQTTSIFFVPTYGTNHSEIAQGIAPNGSSIAFIPQQGHISGSAFVPATTTVQGIPSGTTVVSVPTSGLALGNAPISQSFAAELFENHHEYVLSFDVPGIDIEDLDISLAGNTIYINGIRKDSREASTLAYSEIAKGNITRAIAVPFDVSATKAINTSLENGVLKIRIAKENHGDKKSSARKVKIG